MSGKTSVSSSEIVPLRRTIEMALVAFIEYWFGPPGVVNRSGFEARSTRVNDSKLKESDWNKISIWAFDGASYLTQILCSGGSQSAPNNDPAGT